MKPLRPVELRPGMSTRELLEQMEDGSFGARSLGHALRVLQRVFTDADCGVVLTVSGALSIAQMGQIFATLINRGLVHCVVTTGAVVTHQIVQELGLTQYRADASVDDERLALERMNRVYDSLEPEANLEALSAFIERVTPELSGPMGSAKLIEFLSVRLPMSGSWLSSAARRGVAIYTPAFTDSELGLSVHTHRRSDFFFDAMQDLDAYATWVRAQKSIAVITLGGGVPRNWAMQMVPHLRSRGCEPPSVVAGLRICPDVAAYGHLSGSTYSEAITWGKLDASDFSNFAEVMGDATIIFPILALAALQSLKPI